MQELTTNNSTTKQKNHNGNSTLYFFQGIACILVVLIHIPFPGVVGTFFDSLARLAVPLFYMVSGYTLYRYIESDAYKTKLAARIKKNAIVTVSVIFVYILIDIVKLLLQHGSFSEYLLGIVEPSNIVLLLIVGIIPIGSAKVLWFIYGLVYVYIVLYIARPKKKNIYRNAIISLVITTLFTACKIIFTANPITFLGLNLSEYWIYGNWAIIGLTSVTIGMAIAKFINEYPEKVQSIRRMAPLLAIVSIVLNFVLCFYLDKKYGMYLSYTVFTLILDFLIFIVSTKDIISSKNPMAILGKDHSRNVYLWHPLFVSITNYAVIFLGLNNSIIADWGQPFAVIIATIVFSIVMNIIFGLIKRKKAKGK